MSPNVDDYPILTQNLERGNCCYVNTDFWLILRGLFQKKVSKFFFIFDGMPTIERDCGPKPSTWPHFKKVG